jgi:hypothetical protein
LMCNCQLFVPVFVNTGNNAQVKLTRIPGKRKEPPAAGARLRRLLEVSRRGDHPGGPPARGLGSMLSRWYSKALSFTDRRHANKTMRPRRQVFVRVLAPYTMSPQGFGPCGK